MVSEFLASPGGKLSDLTALRNRQGWLMRGGDRLVNGCSWMNGICSGFLHLTGKSETFSYRRPSSASLRSAASPRGKPRGGSDGCFHTMHPVVPEAAGRQVGDPYSGGEDPASGRLSPPYWCCGRHGYFVPEGRRPPNENWLGGSIPSQPLCAGMSVSSYSRSGRSPR